MPMATLNDYISINISRTTTAVATTGFGVAMFVDEITEFSDSRTRTYTSVAGVLEDFADTTNTYKAAVKYFGQERVPTQLIVGRKVPTTETWVEAITACSAENDNWYVLTAATRDATEQEAIADYIETLYKWYYTASADTDAQSVATTDDIGSVIKTNAYDRTKVMWSGEADTDFPELGHIGLCITYTPGQVDWMYKTIAGVTPDSFSSTVKTVLGTKGYITYETLGGVNVTLMANDLSGLEYIDTINIVDYLHARMQEGVYALLVNQPKVPYTPSGATSIQAILLGVLSDQVTIGGLAATPAPTVYVPNPRNLSQADRTGRILSGVTFEATLAGSIRYVKVNGTVTI